MEKAEILKDVKRAVGIAGIVSGVIGIFAAIAIYFILSPIIDRTGAAVVVLIDHATVAVNGAGASVNSASSSAESLSEFSQNLSLSVGNLENGSSELSSSLSSLSTSLGDIGVSGDSLHQLNESASSFSDFSSGLEDAGASISALSNSTQELSSNLNSTRDGIASAEVDIGQIKGMLNGIIAGLKLALLVGTFMVILFFLVLMCYSAGILL